MSYRIYDKDKKKQTGLETIGHLLRSLLGVLVSIYMILILGILPFYNTEGYERIGTDKASFLAWTGVYFGKAALLVVICCFVYSAAVFFVEKRGQKPKLHFSVTDIFACLYGVSLLVSYAASRYKETAVWGARGWYMGLYTQLILLGSYFLISRFWNRKKWILYLAFGVSGIVFVLGYLNCFGIYPIDMKIKLSSFLSTIGNINWYCGYLVTILFGGVFLLWKGEGRSWEILLTLYVMLGFATLVTQGSSSGILALGAVLLLLFCLSAKEAALMQSFWRIMLLLGIACLGSMAIRFAFPERITYASEVTNLFTYSVLPVILPMVSALFYSLCIWAGKKGIYPQNKVRLLANIIWIGTLVAVGIFLLLMIINTKWPGSIGALSKVPVFTFGPAWGSSRGATWSAAIMCFAEQDFLHKLVGVGPDCMSAYLYADGSEALRSAVQEHFSGATLTNAHNEWLNVLVDMGMLGAVSYIGMVISGIVRYLKKRNVSKIAVMAGICLLAYTVNNFVSFQQAMNASTMFVIWGMGEAYAREKSAREAC